MKKTVFIILALLSFYSAVFSEEVMISGNKTILYGLDSTVMKIIDIQNKKELKNVLDSIELGFFIDGKVIRMMEMNPKAEYIAGTSIIKIESSYQKVKFNTYILSTIEENRDSIFVVTNIKNGDAKNVKNIKTFFLINSSLIKSSIKFDRVKRAYVEEKTAIRALNNNFMLYFTNEKDYRELKFRKCNSDEDIKNEGEKLFFVSETGDVERYGEKRDIVEINISGGNIYDAEKDLEKDNIVDREIGIWEHWQGNIEVLKNSEIDLKNIKQTEMFLKLAQREDGAVLTALLKENEIIKSEEMLYAILAFVKSGHYQEAKEAIEYIINSKIDEKEKVMADYGYLLNKNQENKMVRGDGEVYSYYMQALYLYAFSEYVIYSNDIAMLRKEYKLSVKKQADYLLSKIKDGIVEPDCYNGEMGAESADYYLNTTFLTLIALESFLKSTEFYIPESELSTYRIKVEELKNGINKFIFNKKIVDTLKLKEVRLRNGVVLQSRFIEEKESIKQTLDSYREIYKKNIGNTGEKESIEIDLLYAMALATTKENSEYKSVEDRIDNILIKNGYVIPEYVKTGEKTIKYGVNGIDTKLNALYIIMKRGLINE